MHNTRKIQEDLIYVGANDRRLALFENHYPIPRGVSYNAYVVLDEKTVLLDTADAAVSDQFFENVEYALGGRPLDYIIVNHMEPDHCASLGRLLEVYPEATIICNSKTLTMIHQFFRTNIEDRVMIIKDRFEEYLQFCCESGKPFGDFVEEDFDDEVESWEE